jgi:TRAP-type C4-dicarboxylate transport system permease large subunit
MDLKSFHVVFIACAVALALLVGLWVLSQSGLSGTPRVLAAAGAFAVAVGLIVYEAWFLRYARRRR